MISKIVRAVILGAPASGKGTISSRIVKNFNFKHISSGDKLRTNIQAGTALGLEAKTYVESGGLVPDNLMISLILDEIKKIGENNWLLDGFPRTLKQAEKLWEHHQFDIVINLCVPFDVIIDRVKGRWIHLPSGRVYNTDFNAPRVPGKDDITGEDLVQREDDKPEVVGRRLAAYSAQIEPLIGFYAQKGILNDFHGRTSDEIWPKVAKRLDEYLKCGPESKL